MMNTTWKDLRYKLLHSDSRMPLLIGVNVFIFLAINIPAVVEQLFSGFGHSNILAFTHEYLKLMAYLPALGAHFWTPVTYMFINTDIFGILFNMLWLYWMGQLFEEYLGYKRIVSLYFLGGFAGAFLFVLAYNTLPAFSNSPWLGVPIDGSSTCVMAVIVATATLLPDYTLYLMFLGPVKLKWLAVAYVVIDFLTIVSSNPGSEIAHIGGALMGFIYIKQLKRGNDWSQGINNIFKSKSKIKVVSKNTSYNRDASTYPRQDEVDVILDKISHSGYDSLTKQEKEILFRASNNER